MLSGLPKVPQPRGGEAGSTVQVDSGGLGFFFPQPHSRHVEIPGPVIKPAPQQQPQAASVKTLDLPPPTV